MNASQTLSETALAVELLDSEQARMLLGCGKQRVYKLIQQGALKVHHTDKLVKYDAINKIDLPYTKHWYLKEDVLQAKEIMLEKDSKLKQMRHDNKYTHYFTAIPKVSRTYDKYDLLKDIEDLEDLEDLDN